MDIRQIGQIKFIDSDTEKRLKLTVMTHGPNVRFYVKQRGRKEIEMTLCTQICRDLARQLRKAAKVADKESG